MKPFVFPLTAVLIAGLVAVALRHGSTGHRIVALRLVGPSAAATVRPWEVRTDRDVVSPQLQARRAHLPRPSLNWDALAGCESSHHWADNTGNGYYGGVQMNLDFWRTYGGRRYAARPDLASRRQQIRVGLNGYHARGSQPWPQCGYLLGGSR